MAQLATDLLLISRNPATGRLRHRAALEKGLRAALFAELVLAQLLVNERGAPHATSADPLEDRVLNSVLRTVAAKPFVRWQRWYHHVDSDREVLTEALVTTGRWSSDRDQLGRAAWTDTDQDASLVITHDAQRVADLQQAPKDREQAVLAILVTMCGSIVGRPRPRQWRRSLAPLLDAIGPPADPVRRDMEAVLRSCSWGVRHRRRLLPP